MFISVTVLIVVGITRSLVSYTMGLLFLSVLSLLKLVHSFCVEEQVSTCFLFFGEHCVLFVG